MQFSLNNIGRRVVINNQISDFSAPSQSNSSVISNEEFLSEASLPKSPRDSMILLMSVFVRPAIPTIYRSDTQGYSKLEILKYTIKSYKRLPFTDLYFYISLQDVYKSEIESLKEFIYSTFSHIDANKIHITDTVYTSQSEWAPVITNLMKNHGPEQAVWFTQNDDHPFIDYNLDILQEGLRTMSDCKHAHKSIAPTHWPEAIKLSGRNQSNRLVGNYIQFDMTATESMQIMNLRLLYHIFVRHEWVRTHSRTDYILTDFNQTNPFNQTIFIPLRELVRHFDGYGHVRMNPDDCPPLHLPYNEFTYDESTLIRKMTAKHSSYWTTNNTFEIPQNYIDIMLSVHKDAPISFIV